MASEEGLALNQRLRFCSPSSILPAALGIWKDPDFRGSVAVWGEESSHSLVMQIVSSKTKLHMGVGKGEKTRLR